MSNKNKPGNNKPVSIWDQKTTRTPISESDQKSDKQKPKK
jgi:hypothetical protein